MSSVDPPAASGQPDFVGALLVADTRAFVAEWRQWGAAQTADADRDRAREGDAFVKLRERSKTLQLRARAAGVGGLAHHLAVAEECLLGGSSGDRLEECLANILELADQLEQEIELPRLPSPLLPSLASGTAECPHDRASGSPGMQEPAPQPPPLAPVTAPWRGWKRMPLAAVPSVVAAPAPAAPAPAAPAPAAPAPAVPAPAVPADVTQDGAVALREVSGLTPIAASPAVAATEAPASEPPATEPPATEPPATEPPATESPATEPPATEPPATEPPATEPPATESPATEPPATEPPATEPPATESPAVGADESLRVESEAELLPAEFVVDDDEEDEEDDELTDQDLEIPLHLSRRTSRLPLLLAPHEVAIELPPPSAPLLRKRRGARRARWLTFLALGIAGSGGALALVFARTGAQPAEVGADGATVTRSRALLPQHSSGSEKGLYVLLAQAHLYGARSDGVPHESPQLGQLLDDEAAAIAQAMTEPCAPGSLACELSEQGRLLLEPQPSEAEPVEGPAAGAALPASAWLSGLHTPSIGLPNAAQLEKQLESQTKDAVGHEMFQSLLFQCAPFQGLLAGTLTERGLPLDLAAIVLVESGCRADTESPIGGRGLWHLTRAQARAYHLRVQARVIDERLNAAKATEAALDLLSDLNAKLGSWPLALAGYQLGSFNVVARLRQLGTQADYAALVNAGLLPSDTLNYVAEVQAFALILANLEHFQFTAPPERVGSTSTALQVPAGTRLGLVARAVGSSALRIRELNPELIAEIVPGAAGEEFSLRVPGDGGPSVRDQLERLIARADGADSCVPLNFDWGRQQLTRAMLNRCKR